MSLQPSGFSFGPGGLKNTFQLNIVYFSLSWLKDEGFEDMGYLGWKFVGNHRTGDNVCNYIKDKLETYTESAYSGISIFILYMYIRGEGGGGGGWWVFFIPRENGQIVI